jgi:aldose 1-epimerase
MAGDPSPLHGQGWLNPWNVEESDDGSATFSFRHEPGEWPWAYTARQDFRLDGPILDLTLTCHNDSREPMPCGLGQHPYFPCSANTRLETEVGFAWTVDDLVLPVARVPATGRYDLGNRAICGQDLDNGFEDWSGRVIMNDPDWPYEIELSSPQARFFQVFSPASGGFFVAEPVTHANAAMNARERDWPRLGLRILERGEEMRLDMRIEVRTK